MAIKYGALGPVRRCAIQLDWERKYRAALVERNPALQSLRIEEAYEAVLRRLNEIEQTCDERHKLDNAIDTLNRLRDRP